MVCFLYLLYMKDEFLKVKVFEGEIRNNVCFCVFFGKVYFFFWRGVNKECGMSRGNWGRFLEDLYSVVSLVTDVKESIAVERQTHGITQFPTLGSVVSK